MSIFLDKKYPAISSPYDAGEKRYYEEKQRQFQMQMKQMQIQHEADLAQRHTASKAGNIPSVNELVVRIMDMQKKYIDRLEAENARLVKELARKEQAGGEQASTEVIPT